MVPRRVSRRDALKAIGATGVSLSVAGCIDSSTSDSAALTEEAAALDPVVDRYDGSVEQAFADGYTQVRGPAVAGLGWELTNPEKMAAQAEEGFDPTDPVALTVDSESRLGALVWKAPAEAVGKTPALFPEAESAPEDRWRVQRPSTRVFALPDGEQTPKSSFSREELLTNDYWGVLENPTTNPGWPERAEWGEVPQGGFRTLDSSSDGEERVVDFVLRNPTNRICTMWVGVENTNGLFEAYNGAFAQEF